MYIEKVSILHGLDEEEIESETNAKSAKEWERF